MKGLDNSTRFDNSLNSFSERLNQGLEGLASPKTDPKHVVAVRRLELLEKELGISKSLSDGFSSRVGEIVRVYETRVLNSLEHALQEREPLNFDINQVKKRINTLKLLSNQIQQLELILKMEKFGLLPSLLDFLRNKFQPNFSGPPY